MNYTRVINSARGVRGAKKITERSLIGERGVALIRKRVLDMGFVWHDRRVDAGIDGEIELRDPATEFALNRLILVQSKASEQPFTRETATSFEYLSSLADLAYWLDGNAPVLLVCSHPSTDEAWWVSIKDYFADPARRASRRVQFDKRAMRFDAAAAGAAHQQPACGDERASEDPQRAHLRHRRRRRRRPVGGGRRERP